MQQTTLFPIIRREVQDLLNGYLQTTSILEKIDNYIVPAKLGSRAGALGAMEERKKKEIPFAFGSRRQRRYRSTVLSSQVAYMYR